MSSQSFSRVCDPMDCSRPGSSDHEAFLGKNTGVGCHALLQGIFSIQGLNPGLPHCRQILYHLSHQGMGILSCWYTLKIKARSLSLEGNDLSFKMAQNFSLFMCQGPGFSLSMAGLSLVEFPARQSRERKPPSQFKSSARGCVEFT